MEGRTCMVSSEGQSPGTCSRTGARKQRGAGKEGDALFPTLSCFLAVSVTVQVKGILYCLVTLDELAF